jgi:hypothetical protein
MARESRVIDMHKLDAVFTSIPFCAFNEKMFADSLRKIRACYNRAFYFLTSYLFLAKAVALINTAESPRSHVPFKVRTRLDATSF